MTSVKLVTDSSACVPSPALNEGGLHVLPVVIHLPSGDVRSDAGLAPRLVYEALARDEPVKSSAPSPVEYLSAIEDGDRVGAVVITPAAEFTVMYRNACLAAELARVPVAVIDSRTAAAAHGLVVMAASEAAAAGGSLEEVARAAEEASRRVELVAALDRLEFIRRSGRVPSVALSFAEQLGIRPVFRLHDGVVERLAIPRSPGAALRRIVKEALAKGFREARLSAAFHADAHQRAQELRRLLGGTDFVTEFSPSMGIHTGPGVVGVAWLGAPAG